MPDDEPEILGQAVLIEGTSSLAHTQLRPISHIAQLRLDAMRESHARAPYGHEVVVSWAGNYYPVFPGSVTVQGGRSSNYVSAALAQQPLLLSVAWAEKPLGELFEKVREVLEDRCGFDLEGMVAGVRGFDGVIDGQVTLDDVVEEYFEVEKGRSGPVVLGFKRGAVQ